MQLPALADVDSCRCSFWSPEMFCPPNDATLKLVLKSSSDVNAQDLRVGTFCIFILQMLVDYCSYGIDKLKSNVKGT